MVAVFWQLKWRLVRNGWRGGAARVVASVVGLLAGAGLAALGLVATVGLRWAAPDVAATAVVLGGSVVVLGWVVLPVVAYGVDETLEPSRFALLPVPRRALLTGLLAAALSSVLQGRRARDVLSVLAVLGLSSLGLVQLALGQVAERTSQELLDRVVGILAWTPLGAAWAAPHDAVTGAPVTGAVRLALVAVTVALLAVGWDAALRRQLEGGGATSGAARVRAGDALTPPAVARLLPVGPAGAVASRALRYWWRDPRQRVTLVVLPVVLVVVGVGPVATSLPRDLLLVVGPAMAALLGLTMLNETAWDGTALWTHLAAGLRGRDDRLGRTLAVLLWAGPTVALLGAAATLLAGRPVLLPAVVGATLAILLAGLAVAAVVGVVAPFSVADAGSNPFGSPSGGNVVTVAQQLLGAGVTGTLSLPALGLLAAAVLWSPAVGWLLLVAGPAYGVGLLALGTRTGGTHLDERGPEVLLAITHRR